jgi:hypothetical protein
VGEAAGCSARGNPSLRGEGTAGCRRCEGALCREVNLGEGSGGRGGLEAGEGLYCGRSYAGGSDVSICKLAGWFALPAPKLLLVGEAKPFGG